MRHSYLRYFIYTSLFFGTALSAYALDITPVVTEDQGSHEIKVSVFVDPGNESVNAYEGKVIYDESALFLKRTETGGSIVSQWLTFPDKQSAPIGSEGISFEGVTPGSFSGVIVPNNEAKRQGLLFDLIFDGRTEGGTSIRFKDMAVYRSDGRATKIPVTDKKISLVVKEGYVKDAVSLISAKKRTVENEGNDDVYVSVEASPDLYNGKPFIVFNNLLTQKSPVRYEVSELPVVDPRGIPDYSWTEAKSPYMLTQPGLSNVVHVRVTYTDGTYSYKTIDTVEKTKEGDEFSYILMIATLLLLTFLYVLYSVLFKKKNLA